MDLLVCIDRTFLGHLSEILGKVHVLGMCELFRCLDGAHLDISVSDCLLFCKEHDTVVSEQYCLGNTDMDYSEDIALDNKHRHGSLKLLALIGSEIADFYIKIIDYLICKPVEIKYCLV